MDCIFKLRGELSDLRAKSRHWVQLLNLTDHLVAFTKQITDHLDQVFILTRKLLTVKDYLLNVRTDAIQVEIRFLFVY